MRKAKYLVFLFCVMAACSKNDPTGPSNGPSPSQPTASLEMTMTSTGRISSSSGKQAAGFFSRPVQDWIPSASWTACPEYIELTIKSIIATGNFINSIDTIVDTIITNGVVERDTTIDTTWQLKSVEAWTGAEPIQFNGSATTLSNFDSLEIPQGTLYSIDVRVSPVAKIKGSITASFLIGATTTDSATKTYYTKAAYPFDAYTNTGGSADASAFEQGPSEETTVNIDPSQDPNAWKSISTACTTSVGDSLA